MKSRILIHDRNRKTVDRRPLGMYLNVLDIKDVFKDRDSNGAVIIWVDEEGDENITITKESIEEVRDMLDDFWLV